MRKVTVGVLGLVLISLVAGCKEDGPERPAQPTAPTTPAPADLPAGQEIPICTDPHHREEPAISGDWVVWEDWRNGSYPYGNLDIYAYNLAM